MTHNQNYHAVILVARSLIMSALTWLVYMVAVCLCGQLLLVRSLAGLPLAVKTHHILGYEILSFKVTINCAEGC